MISEYHFSVSMSQILYHIWPGNSTLEVSVYSFILRVFQNRDWQMFSVKGQIVNILTFWATRSLLQLLNSAVVAQKQPQTMHKWTVGFNKILLMDTDFWTLYNFHIVKYYSSFDFFFPTI